MGYITRYHRKHYVKRSIRKDLYERLIKWCGESGINICLEKALSILEPLKSIPKQEDKSKKARTWWWG